MSRKLLLPMMAALMLCAATTGCGNDFADSRDQRTEECATLYAMARSTADSVMVGAVVPPSGTSTRCRSLRAAQLGGAR